MFSFNLDLVFSGQVTVSVLNQDGYLSFSGHSSKYILLVEGIVCPELAGNTKSFQEEGAELRFKSSYQTRSVNPETPKLTIPGASVIYCCVTTCPQTQRL